MDVWYLFEKEVHSADVRDKIGIQKRNRLRWFGHVERKNKEDWVRKCMHMEKEVARSRGRPRIS